MATRSMPTVSCLFIRKAILSLVPTPSVPETRTGFLYFFRAKRPPNPPMSVRTSGRKVDLDKGLYLLDKEVAGIDINPCVLIGYCH